MNSHSGTMNSVVTIAITISATLSTICVTFISANDKLKTRK